MANRKPPLVGLLFAQFSAYHIDRCAAVARRLAGRYEVVAVEVATASRTYAWDPSGEVAGARKVTLFPRQPYEAIPVLRRFWSQYRALRQCRIVLIGIGYNEPDVIVLAWLLRLRGCAVVVMSESKFDDKPRRAGFEFAKTLLLGAYGAAIVGGRRHAEYFHFLGFRRRPVLPGYDTVGLDRIRAMAAPTLDVVAYAERNFVFVGRFVDMKNLAELVRGYAAYRQRAGPTARRLVLVGSGPEEPRLRELIAQLNIADSIDFPGFLGPDAVARVLAKSLALVLVSREEQWGLVVNEALAFGLPVIISPAVGSGDVLVRNLFNGFVVENGSTDGLAQAMMILSGNEKDWQRMGQASRARAWLGDTERLAVAVELLLDPAAAGAAERIAAFRAEMA